MSDYIYENFRRIQYDGGATFIPVCPKCGKFVKADDSVKTSEWDGRLSEEPNATCKKCGRVNMPFEGFIGNVE
jgi:hypothetical protein